MIISFAKVSGEIREGSFLFQRLSVLIQHYTALWNIFVQKIATLKK